MQARRRTCVVGVDATDAGRQALDWARAALGPEDLIVAAHAWDLPTMLGLDESTTIPVAEMGSIAERGLAELVAGLADDRIDPVVGEGRAGRVLVGLADERDADLVVVGHEGSGRASIVLGSTANHVVHRADRPVVVVRGDGASPPASIVVGVDDGPADSEPGESVSAVRLAAAMWPSARLRVVHARGESDADGVAQRVADAAALDPGIVVEADDVDGSPASVMIESSRRADLVVVGSRGRGGFAGLVLGSTGLELVSHSHCPVMVVR